MNTLPSHDLLNRHDGIGEQLATHWRWRRPQRKVLTFHQVRGLMIKRRETVFTPRSGWKRKNIRWSAVAVGVQTEPFVVSPFGGGVNPLTVETPSPGPTREVTESARANELDFLQHEVKVQAIGAHVIPLNITLRR